MKRTLMEILACPKCKFHPLELKVTKEEKGEILDAVITCPKCHIEYPVEEGIPNMLIPEGR
jgi:uncharacterized protein